MTQDQGKSHAEWAIQAWDELIQQAKSNNKLTYSELALSLGTRNARMMGRVLDYIFQFCKLHRLPPLTVIVVSKTNGVPGSGMGNYTSADFESVYGYDWQKLPVPTAAELKEAFLIGKGNSTQHDYTERKFQKIRKQIAPFLRKKDNESD